MSPVMFFLVGMLLIWAVVSGKAGAIWGAITNSGGTGNPVQPVSP